MALKRMNKIAALVVAAVMAAEAGLTSFVPLTAEAKEAAAENEAVNVEESGKTARFTWDNVTAYFLLTDRFYNGDPSNDHSYGRGLDRDGKSPQKGLDYKTNPGTFHGGDLKGLIQKVEEGYFTDLGVNAIWLTAPYEQIHGYTSGNKYGNNATEPNGTGFPYYAYHGYWTLDYTNIDANMGTEKDFETFVDACHSRGIRVIMDVVLNHTGYATIKDCVDLGMDDAITSDALDYYYSDVKDLIGGDPEAANYYNVGSSDWADKWWGTDFVRVNSDYAGYKNVGKSAGLTSTLCGLPDVYTESEKEVALPPHLKKLWTDAGRYEKETQELEEFFSKTGLKKTPRNYVIKWLTDWVRDYGVDGYRCDTAAHVEQEGWGALKEQAVAALKEWRAENPDKPGADWTDDFWMTGEAWGHGVVKDSYYTTGGFDSMVNFSFPKDGNLGSLEGTYSSYAKTINSDEDFNVLSYVTSHDHNACTKVFGSSNNKNIGTSLLLSPGGVQIYYGNETNRGLGWTDLFENDNAEYQDQRFRTDMNWGENPDNLAHWQKLGKFRNNHPAVGAGQHEKLEGDVYTFSRTYHLEEEDEDKVVVAIPGKAGTFDISVGDVFEEGETLTDAYTGEKYNVAGGAVSATCDENGVILLQGSGIVKPSVNAKAKNGNAYKTDTLSVTLKANKVTDTYYSINGGQKKPYKKDDVIAIGGDTAYEEETTLVVEGKSEEDGTLITKTFTYKRSSEPVVSDGLCIKVSKEEFADAPNAYVYVTDASGTETALTAKWPGDAMTEEKDSWVCELGETEIEGTVRFILNWEGGRSTPDMQPGIEFTGGVEWSKATGETTPIPVGEPGKVIVRYVDQNGKDIRDSIYRVGAVGKEYTTYPTEQDGYTLTKTPDNATGIFEKESTVTYVYTKGGIDIPTPTITEPPVPTTTGTPTPTITTTLTPTPTPIPGEFVVEEFVAVKTAAGIKLIASAAGGKGTIRYMFSYEKDGKEVLIENFQPESQVDWAPKAAGTYKLNVYAVNNGTILDKSIASYTVR